MNVEIYYLAAVCGFTAILWMPYILNRLVSGQGLLHEVGYPAQDTVLSPWAARLKKAHENAVQNLAVFAPLVLAAQVAGVSTGATILAASVYLWARIAHAVAYTFAIPWLRTIAFTAGFGCQATYALALLTA